MDSAQGRDLAPIFGEASQIERHSVIKPPLERVVSILRAAKKSRSESFIIKSTYNWKGLVTALKTCLCPL